MSPRKFIIIVCALCLVIILPYIVAWVGQGPDYVFAGFLQNPIDGNSYLSKMYQGWSGTWQFVLPYTANPGEGTYIFMFYLLLGHIAHLFNLPLVIAFHLFRLLGFLALLFALKEFCQVYLSFNRDFMLTSFILSAIGSGLGWVLIPFGSYSLDAWVAEAYPFLSGYTNPHFPFGIALILWIFILAEKKDTFKRNILFSLCGLFLVNILPFGMVIVAAVLFCLFIIRWFYFRSFNVKPFLYSISLGGPILLYQYFVINSHPVLSLWNAQNLTPMPSIGDLILSLSPSFIFAIIGIISYFRRKEQPKSLLLIVWVIIGFSLLYLPLNLQRRLIVGYFIPVACMAIWGIKSLLVSGKRQKLIWITFLALSLPTNILILFSGFYGISNHSVALYLYKSEAKAFEWLKTHSGQDALILSAPETGLFIPAWTGRRVLYGHPFETANAEQERKIVLDILEQKTTFPEIQAFLKNEKVNYIFFGPREKKIGTMKNLDLFEVVYHSGDTIIYKTGY